MESPKKVRDRLLTVLTGDARRFSSVHLSHKTAVG